MDVRQPRITEDEIQRGLANSNVYAELSRWMDEVSKFGIEHLSFFIDPNSTKAISGRIFFDVSPGESGKIAGINPVAPCKISLPDDFVEMIGKSLNGNFTTEDLQDLLVKIGDAIIGNTNLGKLRQDYDAKEDNQYAKENQKRKYGKNTGASEALFNCILAEASYQVLEKAINTYNLRHKNVDMEERISAKKFEITQAKVASVKEKRPLTQKEEKAITKLEGELIALKQDFFDNNGILKQLRTLVNKNEYNHEKTRILSQRASADSKGHRVNPDAWGEPTQPQARGVFGLFRRSSTPNVGASPKEPTPTKATSDKGNRPKPGGRGGSGE